MHGTTSSPEVALFLPSLCDGGAQRGAVNLARGLARHGVRVDLVLASAQGPFLEHVPDSVRVVNLGVDQVRQAVQPLTAYLRQVNPGCLLSRLTPANIAAISARALAGSPTRVVVAENTHLSGQLEWGGISPQLIATLRWFYSQADHVVANSAGQANDLRGHLQLPLDRITTLYNPVVDDHLKQLSLGKAPHPWFQNHDVPILLAVGRLTAIKDHAHLLQAFAQLRQRRPVRLVILGEGPERPRLEALASELGVAHDVALPGYCANPYAAMRRADAFVLTSRIESLSITLIEALACGCPVVATDCPCGPREILNDGQWGSLVPPGDPTRLAKALDAVLDREVNREQLRRRADDFSLHRIVPQYLELVRRGASPAIRCAA